MTTYRKALLTDGQQIYVYMPPLVKISTIMEKKYPFPEPPTVKQKAATGDEIEIAIEDDPQYVAEKVRISELRARERDEWMYLLALRDVKVPDDFDVSIYADLARLENQEWRPREGERGRKLDYIEWAILGDPINWNRINEALTELMSVDKEAVDIIENSFRNSVER